MKSGLKMKKVNKMFTKIEKQILAGLVKEHIKEVKDDESKIIQLDHPAFLGEEGRYEKALKDLLKKLK